LILELILESDGQKIFFWESLEFPITLFLRDANLEIMCIGLCETERVNCLQACEEDVLCQSECFRNYQPCLDGESHLTPF